MKRLAVQKVSKMVFHGRLVNEVYDPTRGYSYADLSVLATHYIPFPYDVASALTYVNCTHYKSGP